LELWKKKNTESMSFKIKYLFIFILKRTGIFHFHDGSDNSGVRKKYFQKRVLKTSYSTSKITTTIT